MRNATISVLLVLTTTCMAFDAKKFADDYDHHHYAKDINTQALVLQSGDITEATHKWHIPDLQNYHAVTSLSKVRYSIKVNDDTRLWDRKLFTDAQSKAIEEDIHNNVVSTLAKYGVIEVKSTKSDVPLIDVEICIRNYSQASKATIFTVEVKLVVRRTLLDPASKRPITATVWQEQLTHVCTKELPHLPVTEEHADLVKKMTHDADTLVFLLTWSQYRSITTMEAAIQLNTSGILPELFSEYVIR